jgi:predicted nucleic acid-binding protein
MEPSLYLETTIPSYLVGGISAAIPTAAHQMATRRWWQERRNAYRLFVSAAVDEEIGRGDPASARQRQDFLIGLPRLPVTNEVIRLAGEIFAYLRLPESARMDAFHLALSSLHRMDYLLTWNLKHIAGGRVRLALARLHDAKGVHVPAICTPEEILELEDQL